MNSKQFHVTEADQTTDEFEWGEIVWLDSKQMTGTDALTVGMVTIKAGNQNSKHSHPNCDEALYLLSGELKHTLGNESVHLTSGELIHIPQGVPHQGINEGEDDAVAIIVYDTGSREFETVS